MAVIVHHALLGRTSARELLDHDNIPPVSPLSAGVK